MKTIAETLETSRSNLYHKPKAKRKRYGQKADDMLYLSLIRPILEKRPTYGYRRVTPLLNRRLREANQPTVNPKRVYRIMRAYDLTLQRHTGKPDIPHEGKIITLQSNLRWCSDGFEIGCWNGDVVRVAFSLDCCDREAMTYVSTTKGITAEMARDLVAESVEQRFGNVNQLPHPVEWLTDNGSCYTAKETVAFLKSLGFVVCRTPIESPESNGMAEAFVKTFKRDYVAFGNLRDARTVMEQLPEWFEDYNEIAPHKGLRMKSPREYRREVLLAATA